jgi:hypothetical protein
MSYNQISSKPGSKLRAEASVFIPTFNNNTSYVLNTQKSNTHTAINGSNTQPIITSSVPTQQLQFNQIIINDFLFTAVEAYTSNDLRQHLFFTSKSLSTNEEYTFPAYKSMSEGFWKILIYAGGKDIFKCENEYVSCTFLHFKLQCLFENVYNRLKNISEDIFNNKYNSVFNKMMNVYNVENYFGITRNISERLYTEDDTFMILYRAEQRIPNVLKKEVSEYDLKEHYYIYLTHTALDYIDGEAESYGKRTTKNITKYKNVIQQFKNSYQGDNTNVEAPIKKLHLFLSQFIETFFDVNTKVQEYQCTMNIQIQIQKDQRNEYGYTKKTVVQEEMFPISIYRTELINKETQVVYDLYYACYIRNKKEYKAIVNILPQNEPVRADGLYARYVSAGPYIYKIFDYTKQCRVQRCDQRYSFLGEMQKDMFPLPALHFQMENTQVPYSIRHTPSYGGRKTKHRKNKRKITHKKRK